VAYLSPEQVEGGVADPRSDVYAAGLVLFEMLTGAPPFTGQGPLEVAYRHVHEDVPAPSARVPGLPAAVDALVRRATSRAPDGRPEDANQFLADVLGVRRGLSHDELDLRPASTADGVAASEATAVISLPAAPLVHAHAGGHDTRAFDRADLPRVLGTADATRSLPVLRATADASPVGAGTTSGPPAVPPVGWSRGPGDGSPTPPALPRRRGRLPVPLLLVLVLGLVLAGGAWWLAAGPANYTQTPALVSLTRAQAEQKAEAAGLRVTVTEAFSETVPTDGVIGTDPPPGERIRKGSAVEVVVSKGKERFEVPDLRGKTFDEAKAQLAELNLVTGDVRRRYDDVVDNGRVVSSTPRAGAMLKRDTAVALVISRGVRPITVPSVVGLRLERAEARLTSAGLKVSTEERVDERVPQGVVISQEPTKGTVRRGATVYLVVSAGPPPVRVPDVIDEKTDDAVEELEDAGFRVKLRGTRLLDRVVTQSPSPDEEAPRGSTVILTTI
jgi:serine/threonine-protein kinase